MGGGGEWWAAANPPQARMAGERSLDVRYHEIEKRVFGAGK
jgi:hypothetical protein